ncbi:MAG: prolyl-tRNA synthetase [Omnitrophica WOR_2 bacterium SM23_29]|nr:MAG: prolyl-tRNA synthetase [Omnitrophica WOR_2 bacterium SM23_29]
MRWSEGFIPTLKEEPAEAEIISHKLMIRAGLIRKLTAGAYSYLPLGFRVLNKIESIIREEMDAKGAQEVLLPALQPSELWKESGRYEDLGEDMVKFIDRHKKEMVMGPTHEEVITGLVHGEVKSYRQLPLILYQIQTKFRDEMRPRFGVIRSREFIMKDAYSFDRDAKGLEASYKKMYDAYCRIFSRCGLSYIIVEADPGVMGGDVSHEFMVLSKSGEDLLAHCKKCGYAASLDKAQCVEKSELEEKELKSLKEVDTPDITTIDKVSKLLNVRPDKMVKTLIYEADGNPIAILVRGDHDINEAKLKRVLNVSHIKLAEPEMIEVVTKAPVGFAGPCGLKGIEMIVDSSLKGLKNFVTGANKRDKHLINVNFDRDFKAEKFADIRYITEDDRCPKCKGDIKIEHAIEVGHVFKLGIKYSQTLSATFLDEDGKEKPFIMGCYGIGVNRIAAALIEQSHDADGIIWHPAIAPYEVVILPLNTEHKPSVDAAEKIYNELTSAGIETILDDRNERAGVKFKDADLIGFPVQVVIGEKRLANGEVEVKDRKTKQVKVVKVTEAAYAVKGLLDVLRK